MDSTVLQTIKNHVAIITFNRPDQLNCFNYQMLLDLDQVIQEVKANPAIRTVIFTGAGGKSFSAGADLKERRTLDENQVRRNVNKIRSVFNQIEELPQPTIAAINGYALGGGFELALACDFRLAVPEAKMGLTEVTWAIIPGAGGTQRLPRLIGSQRAKEMILTGRKVAAEEAQRLGIILEVCDSKHLLTEAVRLAEKVSVNGPLAVIQAKYAIHYGCQTDLHTGLAIEAKAYETIIPTEDRLEALQAFKEKRPPQFKGK
ncbi:enoyl-CoA hydratase-related protein [Halalkalibacterium halodurans]|uniref:Enoyl-CoA hydratase n=1 Tax=Halalkalibacterium halodurans TaxID=86665 RepID=A0A0M0KD93_ALKHA|nr:enoyl-CoA hydratase-related protein [Halalkalibacterium halodurans]TPE68391.1 enoyl-CoA hydratase [Halalkalibacterium halodurans]